MFVHRQNALLEPEYNDDMENINTKEMSDAEQMRQIVNDVMIDLAVEEALEKEEQNKVVEDIPKTPLQIEQEKDNKVVEEPPKTPLEKEQDLNIKLERLATDAHKIECQQDQTNKDNVRNSVLLEIGQLVPAGEPGNYTTKGFNENGKYFILVSISDNMFKMEKK